MVTYIRADLKFILEQIKISQAHAAGQPLFGPGGPGPDGIMGDNPATVGGNAGADDTRPVNTTTSFVDQNPTYASHSSHQVFLRQYAGPAAPALPALQPF